MGRTALYELHDDAGVLLYVGISNRPRVRFAKHAHDKVWWPEVATWTVTWHETRDGAALAEVTAIRTKRPRHNKALPDEYGVYRVAGRRPPLSPDHVAVLERLASIVDPAARAIEIGRQLQAIPKTQQRLAGMRQAAVLEMRANGTTLAKIGAELGVSSGRAQQISIGE